MDQSKTISGKITHVFGHRFVVRTDAGDVLADLTPKGIELITLRIDDHVTCEGEMKPSELKVDRLTRGGETVRVKHKKKPHENHDRHADPSIAQESARAAGFTIVGMPRRKPKHFEILGRKHGTFSELHIELNGHIRKLKPVSGDDHKWSADLPGAA